MPTVRHVETGTTLATDVDVADTFLGRSLGLMFRSSIPDDYALVFEFDTTDTRQVHTVFVGMHLDVCWLNDGEVVAVETMPPMRGLTEHDAGTIVEASAGTFDDVEAGDRLVIADE